MKLIGNLLLVVSLIAAMLSAATSYVAFLEGATPGTFQDEGTEARLKSPAGVIEPTAEELAELEARRDAGELSAEDYVAARRAVGTVLSASADEGGTRITAERLDELRVAGVETVYLKSFSLGRWKHGWVFLFSALGLLIGSLLVRTADRREIAAAGVSSQGRERSPAAALDALVELLADLDRGLRDTRSETDRLALILERLEEAQRTYVVTFVEGRALLVGRMGMSGYAELMDRFAAGERQLNRAWSAAADSVLAESEDCVRMAHFWMQEAKDRLAAG